MQIKVLLQVGGNSLVEWTDGDVVNRVYIPSSEVVNNSTSIDTLNSGVQYGLDFESLKIPSITSEMLAHEMRRRGLWTVDDVMKYPNKVIAALQSVYRLDLGTLRNAVRLLESDTKGEQE
jgi:hypothetical protein